MIQKTCFREQRSRIHLVRNQTATIELESQRHTNMNDRSISRSMAIRTTRRMRGRAENYVNHWGCNKHRVVDFRIFNYTECRPTTSIYSLYYFRYIDRRVEIIPCQLAVI